jgi:hypothetical protein
MKIAYPNENNEKKRLCFTLQSISKKEYDVLADLSSLVNNQKVYSYGFNTSNIRY